ncbi:MAG: tetratricopeptide repeat protein [Nitrospira sp.]|nr:tetratricopeptide repeat protein [Nitrospira sp.]
MSYRIKVPARTLQVDEAHFVSGLEHALHRVQDYRKPLLVGLSVLVLAVVVVAGVFWFDRQASHKAQDLEQEATRLFMTRPTAGPAKSDATLKEAIEKYRQVVDQYPRTPSAPLALFHLGNALMQANDYPGAIEAYQRFIMLYGSQPTLVGLAQQRLAYTYLLKGDRDQAVKTFMSIVESTGALNKDQALFELARLEEAQSRPEGALAHYQELIKSYPASPYTNEAMVRTKMLDTKRPAESVSTPPAASTKPTSSASETGKKKK